jgi:hypothetical protein
MTTPENKMSFEALRRLAFAPDIARHFSEEEKAQAALRIAARISRGNTNMQNIRVTTESDFERRMDEYEKKVIAKRFAFQH